MCSSEHLPTLDRATLLPLAQAATDCPNLHIDMWQMTLLSQQGRRRILRFAGTGQEHGAPRAWSLILKVIQAPEGQDNHNEDMRDWAYWPRESLLYENGFPQTLVGEFRAPRCFGVVHPAPNLRWIWLEDLDDRYGGRWPLERYALAASHLGAFNGAAAFGIALLTSSFSLLPGGGGTVETALVALLAQLGVGLAALSSAILFRLLDFWAILPLAAAGYAWLSRCSEVAGNEGTLR